MQLAPTISSQAAAMAAARSAVEQAELGVGARGGLLDDRRARRSDRAYFAIAIPVIGKFSTARGRVHAPIGMRGNLFSTQQIALDANVH